MEIKRYFILITNCILFSSCAGFLTLFDDKLSLEKEDFNGNQLRLDGFYYSITKDSNYPKSILYNFYSFYQNGVVRYIGSAEDFNRYKRKDVRNSLQTENYDWGVYQIKGDSIMFEQWVAGEVSKVVLFTGNILNDSTFVINEKYWSKERKKVKEIRLKNKKSNQKEEIYHFIPYSPKPDSTNSFVK